MRGTAKPAFDRGLLRAGDHLIYWTNDPADFVIGLKTWTRRAGHIEVYCGGGVSVAARANGVKGFPLRLPGLEYVLRPRNWDHGAAMAWFSRHAMNQRYDWLGLLSFALARNMKSPDRRFCSELARDLDRAAGCDSFHADWPGDMTPPSYFLASPAFEWVWDRRGT